MLTGANISSPHKLSGCQCAARSTDVIRVAVHAIIPAIWDFWGFLQRETDFRTALIKNY